jgi:hypothetical protein
MPALKVNANSFSGAANLYGSNGLGAVVAGLAIDHARIKVQVAAVTDMTDSSTGVAGASITDLAIPAVFNATAAGGAALATLNTAIGAARDAQKVIGNKLNTVRTILGLPAVVTHEGVEAAAGTVPAQTKTVTTANGATAADATARTALTVLKANQRKLALALNEILVAIGLAELKVSLGGQITSGAGVTDLPVVPAAVASATGANSISKAATDAFLTGLANNYATMAASWNAAMAQADTAPLRVVAGK